MGAPYQIASLLTIWGIFGTPVGEGQCKVCVWRGGSVVGPEGLEPPTPGLKVKSLFDIRVTNPSVGVS